MLLRYTIWSIEFYSIDISQMIVSWSKNWVQKLGYKCTISRFQNRIPEWWNSSCGVKERLRPGTQNVRIVSIDVNRELSYIDRDPLLHRCFLTIETEMERELESNYMIVMKLSKIIFFGTCRHSIIFYIFNSYNLNDKSELII